MFCFRCELDLAFLKPESNGFIGFALSVDIFNRMVYCIPIKSKKKKELEKRFKALFAKSGKIAIGRGIGGG